MNFPLLSRTLFCSFTKRSLYSSGFFAEKLSKLSFSTSNQRKEGEQSSRYKRPVQPFLRFRSEFIAKVKKETTDLKLPELNHLISEEWSHLDPNIKEEYKRAYEEDMEEFKAPFKKLPHKPAGIYALFVKQNFASVKEDNPQLTAQEIIGKLSEQWKEFPVEKKEILRQKVEQDTERYHSEVIAFEDSLTEYEFDFLNHFAKDQMKKLHDERLKLLNYPKKPSGTFLYFVNMEKEKFPRGEEESMKDWLKRMGMQWRNLTPEEKEKYSVARKRAVVEYEEDVENWRLEQQAKVLDH